MNGNNCPVPLAKENRVFLSDKERSIVSYQLHLSVIEYQTAIVRGDLEGAQSVPLLNHPEVEVGWLPSQKTP